MLLVLKSFHCLILCPLPFLFAGEHKPVRRVFVFPEEVEEEVARVKSYANEVALRHKYGDLKFVNMDGDGDVWTIDANAIKWDRKKTEM